MVDDIIRKLLCHLFSVGVQNIFLINCGYFCWDIDVSELMKMVKLRFERLKYLRVKDSAVGLES